MIVLIEQQKYSKSQIENILPQYYYCEEHDFVQIPYVGYFYSTDLNDSVFILPKVFIIDGLAFGVYSPEQIMKYGDDVRSEDRKAIFSLSVWLYRAIKKYSSRKQHLEPRMEYLQNVISHHGNNSETMLDIILALLKYAKDHKNLFTYTTKLKHSGNNKISWQKTISKSTPILNKNTPLYLNLINKSKIVTYDEELIILFYSVLNFLNNQYHFDIKPIFGYDLIPPFKIKEMLESGKGLRILRSNRKKYFTDEMVKLWELLFTFFSQSECVDSRKNHNEEAIMVRDFNLIFEDMIDCLVGDDSLSNLKNQKDGKIIDHIYRDRSLIDVNEDIYFIGDSKYYKDGNDLGQSSIYKQFTYAKNVIQYNIDLFNKYGDYHDCVKYRDEKTEGYNITPNFFIRGFIKKDNLVYDDDMLTLSGKEKISYQFENRLFDRDTLILQSYNINFLFVLAAYVQGSEIYSTRIRCKFRKDIQNVLQSRYDFYVIKPRILSDATEFLNQKFQHVLGKIFLPYDKGKTHCLSLALDRDIKFKSVNEELLNDISKYFYIHSINIDQMDNNPDRCFSPNEITIENDQCTQEQVKDGVLCIMMESYNKKSTNFLHSGKIAVGLKDSESYHEILKNLSNIGYVLFHTRSRDTNKHLFKLKRDVKVLTSCSDDCYKILKCAQLFLYVDFFNDFELVSNEINPQTLKFTSLTRYDAQYETIKNLRTHNS